MGVVASFFTQVAERGYQLVDRATYGCAGCRACRVPAIGRETRTQGVEPL